MKGAAERAGYERAVQAAYKGNAEMVSPLPAQGLVVDFITVFHVASDISLQWPTVLVSWAAQAKSNVYLLNRIRAEANHPTGGSTVLLLRLIDELLKAVNG